MRLKLTFFGLMLLAILLALSTTSSAGGGVCALSSGDVLINEVLPAPSSGNEWVELYNTTGSTLDLSDCYIDDVASGGGSPYQIPSGQTIAAGGFWTLDRSGYFNNGGDDVRLLEEDASTVLDSYTYTSTGYDVSWFRRSDGGVWQSSPADTPTKGSTNGGDINCGTGTWVAGNLEIHHINVGQGDATLIVGPTGRTMLLDVGETYWNSSIDAQTIGSYVEDVLGCKDLDYVLITHFHLDHIGYVGYGGLWHLVEEQDFVIGQTLLRDYESYLGSTSGTFNNWATYLAGDGEDTLNPTTAVEGTSQVDLGGGVTFDIVVVDGNEIIDEGDFSSESVPPSENDYSIGAVLSFGLFDEWIGGDLSGEFIESAYSYVYHDIEWSVAPEVGDVDVYRVNHHGSDHSNSETFVNQLDPEVSIISVGDANPYGMPRQAVMDVITPTSDVYLTERGDTSIDIGDAEVVGHIVITTTNGTTYVVDGNVYTATNPTRTDNDGDGYFAEVDPDDNDDDTLPAPNGGCDSDYQTCTTCNLSTGDVVINEILPAPSSGYEWVELYNTTGSSLDLGYCYIDDVASGGGAPYQIPADTTIAAGGYWTLDRSSYFNNGGDYVRLLMDDASTVLDSYSYGSTSYDHSWYRSPDGSSWSATTTSSPTKGTSN